MTAGPAEGRRGPRRAELLALVAILLLATGLRVAFLRHETVVFPDEGAYLELAGNLHDGRGFVSDWKWHHWPDEWDRTITHPEDNRQPALPALLSAVERLVPRGHDRGVGQAVVFSLGLGLVAAVWLYGRLLFGAVAGLAAALLVAVQPSLAQYSAVVMTEVPTALVVVAVGLLLAGRRRPGPLRLVGAGVLTGLAYLLRSNGAWVAVAVAAAVVAGPRPRRWWHWGVPALAFALVVSPWLVRNQRTFGQPLYSGSVMAYVVDTNYALHVLRREPPSWREFHRRHPAGDLVARERHGLATTVKEWSRRYLWPLFALAFLGAVVARRRGQVFAWACLVVTFLGVSWLAPTWDVERYSYPFLPLAAVLGGAGCAAVAARGWAGRVVAALLVAGAAALIATPYPRLLKPYGTAYERKLEAETGVAASLPRDTILAERYGFPWLGSREWQHRRRTIFFHLAIPFTDALARARRLGATYLIVPDGLEGAPQERPLVNHLPLAARGKGWELRRIPPLPAR